MEQDGVQVGFVIDSLILDNSHSSRQRLLHQQQQQQRSSDHSHGDEESISTIAMEDPVGDMSSTGLDVDSRERDEEKKDMSTGESIRKVFECSKCGVFLREIPSSSLLSSQLELAPPKLDDYIIQPTEATVSMCLRRTNLSLDAKVTVHEDTPTPSPNAEDYQRSKLDRQSLVSHDYTDNTSNSESMSPYCRL